MRGPADGHGRDHDGELAIRSAHQPALAVQSFDQRRARIGDASARPTKSTNSRSRTGSPPSPRRSARPGDRRHRPPPEQRARDPPRGIPQASVGPAPAFREPAGPDVARPGNRAGPHRSRTACGRGARSRDFGPVRGHMTSAWWLGLAWSEASDSLGGHRELRSWDQIWAVTAGVDWIRGNWRFGAVVRAPTAAGRRRASRTTRSRRAIPTASRSARRSTCGPSATASPSGSGASPSRSSFTNAINVGNTCCQRLIAEDDGAGGTTFDEGERLAADRALGRASSGNSDAVHTRD